MHWVDCVVDKYFKQLEAIGEEIDDLEEAVIGSPEVATMQRLHALRREILVFRKAVWPLREVLGVLYCSDNPLITKKTVIYFRDVYDHSVQYWILLETFREALSGMKDLYLFSVSNRMNDEGSDHNCDTLYSVIVHCRSIWDELSIHARAEDAVGLPGDPRTDDHCRRWHALVLLAEEMAMRVP